MDTVLLKIKRLFKENSQGAALIMAIVVVSVLFIFTSFLVRRVITNTVMVEKARDEQTSYASAKKGILYAVDRLNNSPGTSPNYDSTDWLDAQNWDKREWNTFDLNKNGENDVCIRIDKNDIPHPDNNDPAFDSANDDDGDSNYITIEAKDLPKKLVTLQGISNYTSPLVKYVRFINSDTTFGNNTFGGSGMIGGEAPFCILGDLTWKGSTTNDVTLTSPNVAKVSGSIVDGGSATVTINGSSPDSGYSYFTPINPGDPDFDTAGGVYFDGEHLPSCYDYSSGSPTYHTGGVKSPFWPYINEERYSNLHNLSTSIFESNCGNRGTGWNDWYPSSFSSGTYWRQDGSTSSYTYTPPGVHIVLTDTPDIILITDSDTNDDPAEYDSSNNSSFISYPTSPIIYAPGDIRIEGIIPAGVQMTVVSGGNIYIESNIYQDSTSSLALLAKKNVIFNTTHRWVVNSPTSNTSIAEDEWTDDSYLEGYTNSQKISASVTTSDTTKTQTVDFGGGTNNIYQTISANRIILRDCDWTVTSGTIELHLEVSLDGSDWIEMSSDEAGTTPVLSTDTNGSGDIDAYIPTDYSHARVFRYIKLILEGNGDVGDIRINSLEVVLEGIEGGVAVFSEEEEWAIIPGNVSSGLPLVFNVALSEKNLEDKTKWNSKWPNISYTYGSTLDSNPPPHLPPSVNLISLRRK